jgi:hypothetical protein
MHFYWEEGMKTLKQSGVMRLPCVLATGRDTCSAEDPDGTEATREVGQVLERLCFPGTPILAFSPTCALGANHLLQYVEGCPKKPPFEDVWAAHTDPQEIAVSRPLVPSYIAIDPLTAYGEPVPWNTPRPTGSKAVSRQEI